MNNTPGPRAIGLLSIVLLLGLAAVVGSQPAPREQVGPLPRGGYLLNSGWRVAPAGRQVPLDTLPMSTALSPDGKYLLVLNAGFKPPSISVVEIASARVVSSIGVPDAWLGEAGCGEVRRVRLPGPADLMIAVR